MLQTLTQLLSSIVDYAGLFPPAQLSLPDAIATYNRAKSSNYHWLLGQFVLPASCLPSFVALLPTFLESSNADDWPLSVILSQNWAAELEQIRQLQTATEPLLIKTFEVVPLPPNDIEQVCRHLPQEVTVFFEIPLNVAIEPYLTTLQPMLQQIGAAVKLRTGGITSDAFPDSVPLAQRILSLAKTQIPFKATAGLHHPLRGKHRLTYELDSAFTTMHGFLNVALLAGLAYQQTLTIGEAVALLEEKSITSFAFTDTAIRWRDYTLSRSELERCRQKFFHSFGSCSVQEPIDDLHTLRLL